MRNRTDGRYAQGSTPHSLPDFLPPTDILVATLDGFGGDAVNDLALSDVPAAEIEARRGFRDTRANAYIAHRRAIDREQGGAGGTDLATLAETVVGGLRRWRAAETPTACDGGTTQSTTQSTTDRKPRRSDQGGIGVDHARSALDDNPRQPRGARQGVRGIEVRCSNLAAQEVRVG